MPGAFIDGEFERHPKRLRVSLAADGLWGRALSRAAGTDSDGFVDEAWMRGQGRASERRRALREALEERLLERVGKGETRTLVGHPKASLRTKPIKVEVGPFPMDGFVVHDYLDHNRSSHEKARKRARDAARKRGDRGLPRLWNGKVAVVEEEMSARTSTRTSAGMPTESSTSSSTSLGNDHGERPGSHAPEPADVTEARRLTGVLATLGVRIDELSVLNALARFPSIAGEMERHVRGYAEYMRAHPDRDPGLALHRWLERELTAGSGPAHFGRSKAERERDDIAALMRLAERSA